MYVVAGLPLHCLRAVSNKCGIAIKPETVLDSISSLEPAVDSIDHKQGCQMAAFQTNSGKFWRALQCKMLVYIF
jgi:hypothetical protein